MRISPLDGGYHRTVEGYDLRKKRKKNKMGGPREQPGKYRKKNLLL